MAEAAIAATVKFIAAAAAKVTVKAVVTAAAKVALMAGVNAVIQNNSKPEQQGGLTTLTINPAEPRRLQIGKRLNGGVLADWYVRGSKNQNLYLVIYLGEGPMGQLTRVFAGGREVYSSTIAHGVRTTIPNFRSGGDRLWVTYYDGRPGQTADSNLVSQGLGWTSTCVGTGCAYAIVECQWDSDNLTSPPSLAFEIEGAKLYDRRLDTTAGGSGSHRINNPSTWAVSSNPAVALDHYLLGRYTGSVKTFGIGLDAEDVPYDRFAALANLCDEDVTLKAGGTQNRYEAAGFLFADRSYSDTIKDLCRAMNARPADFGGRVGILDGQSRTPVLTLTDDDVIEDSPEQYTPKRSWNDLVSVVRGTYQDPRQNYQAIDYPRVTDAAWVTADGGSAKEATLDLEMETDPERAQRLAWLYAMRERRQAQLTGTYKLRAIELEQGDWFIRDSAKFGEDGKVFEVIDRVLDVATMTVTLTAFEVDAADTAWTTDIPADAPAAPVSNEDTLQDMEVPDLTVTGVTLTGTAAQLPAIKVEWTAPADPRVRQIIVEAVPQAGGTPTSVAVDAATEEVVIGAGVTDDTDYYVRARFAGTFAPSDWTSTYSVTTEGDYSVGVATSVPWSGVTDDGGRPEDGADVTATSSAHLAVVSEITAARDGEASLTAKISSVETAYASADSAISSSVTTLTSSVNALGVGANAVKDSEFRFIPDYWSTSITGSGSLATSVEVSTGGLRKLKLIGSSMTAGDVLRISQPAAGRMNCKAGEIIGARAFIGASNESGVQFGIAFRQADGTYISSSFATTATAFAGNLELDSGTEFSRVATAPANTATAELDIRLTASATPATLRMAHPVLARLPSSATAPPRYSAGSPADASVATNAAAIASEASTRASADSAIASDVTTLTATVGTNTSSISTNASAIADIEDAAAYYEVEVAATGSDPAVVSLKSGKDGSEVSLAAKILRLINNVGGTTIEVMRAVGGYVFFSNPISIDRNGYRATLGPNDDLVLWYGADTVDPPDQTIANSIFALATDGETYIGGGSANPLTGATVSPAYDLDFTFGVYSGTCGPFTVTAQGGDGTYTRTTEKVALLSGTDGFTIVDGTTGTPEVDWSSSGAPGAGKMLFRHTITETSTGRKAQIDFVAEYLDTGPP